MPKLELPALLNATFETIYMVFVASYISLLIGTILGSLLFITARKTNSPINLLFNRFLSLTINITRSLPFIILMICLIPFTRLIIGTTIGTNAAIIPLTLAAIPFFARITANALTEVPGGLIEAAHAMGANQWQIVTKILLPESLPALIRGATLTIIALIGYSAMAGVVGGGGLGELAINYGYQRFNMSIMLETVIVLILMVQLIQNTGDHLSQQHPNIKNWVILSTLILAVLLGVQLFKITPASENTLKVGVMSGWPEDVMKIATQIAKQKYNLHLKIVSFNDYVQPNTALVNKSIDANIFQHEPYLQAQKEAHHYPLAIIGKTFVYPIGFYSKKINKLDQLKKHAIVAIPNDPSNCTRALLLLKKSGLINLQENLSYLVTIKDITDNPYQLIFKLLDPAQLPRALTDADLVAITNDFIGVTNLSISDALLKETEDSLYANIIVVREKEKDNQNLQKLVTIMHSKEVLKETNKIFPNGAAIPAW